MNCSPNLDNSMKYAHLSKLNLDLMHAGHSKQFRRNMTLFALDSYRVKLQSGNLFRNKNEILDAARQRPDKSTWFRKAGANPVDAVINIPPTPD